MLEKTMEIAVSLGGFALSLAGAILAIRSELRKSSEAMKNALLEQEKRHSAHEKNISLLKEKTDYIESAIKFRLDEMNARIEKISDLLMESKL